jgi:hypothetical protein
MKKGFVFVIFGLILMNLISFVYSEGNESFQASSNAFFEKDITIPSQFDVFAKIIFGVNESNSLDVSSLIILIALWIFILLIVKSVFEIIPLFGDGWKSWLGAIIVTLLASISGGIKDAAVFFFDLRRLFGLLGNYSFFFIVLNIIILVAMGYGAGKLLHMLKHESRKVAKRQQGFEEGAGI